MVNRLKQKAQNRLFVFISIALVVTLIAGIIVADENTRKIGFSERQPVFDVSSEKDRLTLSAFDISVNIDKGAVSALSEGNAIYNAATPHAAKAGVAFIEMITDSILQLVFPKD